MNNGAGKRIMARKREFVWLWNNQVSSSEMGRYFSCNSSTINIWAKKLGLDRRFISTQRKAEIGENPKEGHALRFAEIAISERKEAIKLNWDKQTEWNRRVQKTRPLTVRHMLWTGLGFADNGEMKSEEVIAVEKFKKSLDDAGHKRPAYRVFN